MKMLGKVMFVRVANAKRPRPHKMFVAQKKYVGILP